MHQCPQSLMHSRRGACSHQQAPKGKSCRHPSPRESRHLGNKTKSVRLPPLLLFPKGTALFVFMDIPPLSGSRSKQNHWTAQLYSCLESRTSSTSKLHHVHFCGDQQFSYYYLDGFPHQKEQDLGASNCARVSSPCQYSTFLPCLLHAAAAARFFPYQQLLRGKAPLLIRRAFRHFCSQTGKVQSSYFISRFVWLWFLFWSSCLRMTRCNVACQ